MKTKKIKQPARVEIIVPTYLPPAKPKPVKRIVTTWHPRYGYIKREVTE